MRCSSCEPLLDRYIEGTLTPRQMIEIAAHLRTCSSCQALHDELRVVDGLLATSVPVELPENFTFAIMAEVNAMPPLRAREHVIWSFLALYSAAAWVAAVMAMIATRTSPRIVLAGFTGTLWKAGVTAGSLCANLAHALSHGFPAFAAFGAGVLLIDVTLACALGVLYFYLRPRLAARLATAREILQ